MKRSVKLSLCMLLLGAAMATGAPAMAQEEAGSGDELDLEALFNTSQVGIAARRAQTTQEAPAIVEVVTAEEIRERGYQSVAEALRALPGFYVVDDLLLPSVGVRGVSSGQRAWSRIVKVMLDGQSVPYRPDGSNWLGPELVPMSLVKRIEVIRGPSSALYGADAYLGVLNVVTKRAADLEGGAVATHAGVQRALPAAGGALTYGTSLEALGLDVSLGATLERSDRSGLLLAPTSPLLTTSSALASKASKGDTTTPGSLFGRMSLKAPLDLDMTLDGAYMKVDSGAEFQDWKPLTGDGRISEENRYLRTQLRRSLLAGVDLGASVAYSYGDPTSDDRISLGRTDYDIQRKLGAEGWDVSTDCNWAFDDRSGVTVGADWTRTTQALPSYFDVFLPTDPRAGQVLPDGPAGASVRLDNVGGFVQAIYYPLDALGLTLNLRDDAHNVYGNSVNSRLGAVYRVSDAVTTKLLYGTSFKAPSAPQLFGRPLLYGDILGDKDLKPETASTLEGAITYAPNRGLDCSANLYYMHVADKISFFTRSGNPYAVNLGQLDSAGLEASVKWRWSFLHGLLNTSLQKTVPTLASGYADPDGVPEPYPIWMANAGVGAPVWGLPMNAYAEGRYTGWVDSSQSNFAANGHSPYALSPAFVLDLTLSSRDVYWLGDKEAILSLKVANLLDTAYSQPGYGGVDYPGLGRTFLLRVSQGF